MTWQRLGSEYCPVGHSGDKTLFNTVVAPQLLHARLPTDHCVIGPEASKFWLGRTLYNTVLTCKNHKKSWVWRHLHFMNYGHWFYPLLRYLSLFTFRPGNLIRTYFEVRNCRFSLLLFVWSITSMCLVSNYQLNTLDHSPSSETWWGIHSCFCWQYP